MTIPLRLVAERKIRDLFPEDPPAGGLEASGVLARNGKFFVVFDNRTDVARIADDLSPNPMNGLFGIAHGRKGYEGIAYDRDRKRYYLLIESRRTRSGKFRPEIFEYGESLAYLSHRPVEFRFSDDKKGFEALAFVRCDGVGYALALCEGNRCRSGKQGRRPGGGRIQLFEIGKRKWSWTGTINLPKTVRFRDYSAMALKDRLLAVVSQEDSMLWLGRFQRHGWDWLDEGSSYSFPRTETGDILYGNVEGVSWIGERRIVVVSDRKKPDQAGQVAAKDQSIHIFDIPDSGD